MSLRDTAPPILGRLKVQNMVFASTIRSGVARASHFQVSASELPSGYRRLLAADLSEGPLPPMKGGFPFFASSEIFYRGQPLGLIVGPDPGICDELAADARVEYEEEEPLLEWESFSSSQIAGKLTRRWGETGSAFASEELRTVRTVYRSEAFDHKYSEPMGALATWEYDKMVIYCASQWPSHVRSTVAACLGVREGDVLVRPTEMGRALDGRLWYPSFVATQAALASRVLSKPVKILYTREEDYLYTPKQARSSVAIRSASDQEGKLRALEIRLIINVGAFNPLADELIRQAAEAATGIYACPAIDLEVYAIRSDIVPLGAFGGIGATHASFAIEAHINHLAKLLEKTPAEIKTLNMLCKACANYDEPALDRDIPFEALHGKLEHISDYRRKYASYELVKKRDPARREGVVRGIALTVGFQTSLSFSSFPGMNSYAVEVTLDRDSKLKISAFSTPSTDQLRRLWRERAAELLSLSPERIEVIEPVTSPTDPAYGPLTLSRGSSVVNALVERACLSIQKRRFREGLPLTARAQARLSVADLRKGDSTRTKRSRFDSASWCGTAVELEIDPLSGKATPLAVWMVVDAGRIARPQAAKSVLRSTVLAALRLCTGVAFDPEKESGLQYLRSAEPSFERVPSVSIEFVGADRVSQSRGLGELPFVTVPAAFYSALTQAIGVEPLKFPLTGDELLKLMEST